MKAGWADASGVKGVPLVAARAEPPVFLAGRPAAERAADARGFRFAGLLTFLKLAVWSNGGSISCWTHLFGSLNSLFFGKAASVFPNHTYFFPTETSVLDRHTEEPVLILLIVGGESILVKQHQVRLIRARFRELWERLPDSSDQG